MTLSTHLSTTRRVALAVGRHALVRSRTLRPVSSSTSSHLLGSYDDDVAQYIPDPEPAEVVTPVSGAARVLQPGGSFGSPSGVVLPLATAVSSSSPGPVPSYGWTASASKEDEICPKTCFYRSGVYNEMVLSLPLSDVENPGIHGLWACNIVGNRVVVLTNNKRVSDELYKEIRDSCVRKNFRGHLMKKLMWRPLESSMSQLQFWIHECKTHNVYEDKLFRDNYFDLAMNMSEDYLYRIPTFIQKYRTELHNAIKSNMLDKKPFDPEVHALKLFSDMATMEFGKKLRINVVEDCRLDLGFLHDEADNNHLTDHPLCHPQAPDVAAFYKYFL